LARFGPASAKRVYLFAQILDAAQFGVCRHHVAHAEHQPVGVAIALDQVVGIAAEYDFIAVKSVSVAPPH